MKSRLFVVNEETRNEVIEAMEVSIVVPEPTERAQWDKTLIDIISDLFQVELGDYIFLWEQGTGKIYGVYRAISKAFYRNDGNNRLFKIKIGEAYRFEEPIKEYDILNDPYMKNKIWNIIGKKVAGKSRGTTPITIEESEFLIQSLIGKNKEYSYIKDFEVHIVDNEVTLDFTNEFESQKPRLLDLYAYRPITVRNGRNVKYEKALEAIMNLMFRDNRADVIRKLNIDMEKVIWYANYLPYGLEKSEIDYMVMESEDGQNVTNINVIELMKGVIDRDHIRRCLQYAKWVKDTVANNDIVRPMLICSNDSKVSANGLSSNEIKTSVDEYKKEYGFERLDIYTYMITDDDIKFEKVVREE